MRTRDPNTLIYLIFERNLFSLTVNANYYRLIVHPTIFSRLLYLFCFNATSSKRVDSSRRNCIKCWLVGRFHSTNTKHCQVDWPFTWSHFMDILIVEIDKGSTINTVLTVSACVLYFCAGVMAYIIRIAPVVGLVSCRNFPLLPTPNS